MGKGKQLAKKLVKKGVKALKNEAAGAVSDAIRDGAKAKAEKRGASFPVSKHGGKRARPDIAASKTIEWKGDRKKRKAKKKIAKWKKETSARAAAGAANKGQAAFLALDKKIKSKNNK